MITKNPQELLCMQWWGGIPLPTHPFILHILTRPSNPFYQSICLSHPYLYSLIRPYVIYPSSIIYSINSPIIHSSIYPLIHLSAHLLIHYLSFIYLPTYLPPSLPTCFIYLFICSLSLSIDLSTHSSIHKSICCSNSQPVSQPFYTSHRVNYGFTLHGALGVVPDTW